MMATTTRSCSACDCAEPPEIAELGATERLHALARRQRDLGDMTVLRAGIDRAVKALVDFVKPIGIAGVAQHPQFLVDRFQPVALGRRHPLRGQPRAQRFQFRHRLEHAAQTLDRGLRHHRAAMGPRFDESRGRKLPQRLAHRRARHIEAPRDVGLVQRRSRRQRAAHDLVGQLQTQFLGASEFVDARAATNDRLRFRNGAKRCQVWEVVKAHAF